MGVFTDIIPAKARKYVYAVVALAAVVYGAWQAADGNWGNALASLLAAAVNGLAHGNVSTEPPADES